MPLRTCGHTVAGSSLAWGSALGGAVHARPGRRDVGPCAPAARIQRAVPTRSSADTDLAGLCNTHCPKLQGPRP